jgi:hypothetical protein
MSEHNYGTHLIKLKADQTPDASYWVGKAHVQYNDGKTFDALRCMDQPKSLIQKKQLSSTFLAWPRH